MKTIQTLIALAALAAGCFTLSARQAADAPAKADSNTAGAAQVPEPATTPTVPANEPPASTGPVEAGSATNGSAVSAARTDGLIMMNFHNASLDTVLNHLSEAAGFIINVKPGTSVRGKVDVWSSQPLTKDEAVDLLDTVLVQNKLAAIRNDRTLTILNLDEAKIGQIPVKLEKDPAKIPRNDQVVTQIIPVQFVEVSQLLKDLQPLVSSQNTTMTANESGNAIVITDTQANIHRVAEIIQAIDMGAQSFTEVRVFKLANADPNETADLLSNLFPDDSKSGGSGGQSSPFSRFASRFGGFGGGGGGPPGFGGGGPGGGGGGGGGGGSDQRVKKRARVIAVADARTASLVVSAAKELMEQIEGVIKELDSDRRGRTVVKTFDIEYTDMQQLQTVMGDIFQKSGTTQNRNNSANTATPLGNRITTSTSSSKSSSTGFGSGSSGRSGGGSLLQP